MGLFNKANNFLANEDEVLLVGEQNDQKNEKTPSYETKIFHQNKLFAFSDFITKYRIHIFAIFELSGSFFTIKDSLGFDGKTISNFAISQEDLNSIFLHNHNISTVNKKDYDFLSKVFLNIKNLSEEFSFCKIGTNYVMFCDCKITDKMLNDFQNIDNSNKLDYDLIYQKYSENQNSYIIKIDFEEAIETFICTNNPINNLSKNIFLNSIYTEICNRFMFWYSYPFYCKQNNDYTLTFFLPSQIDLPEELLLTHIIFNLKDILDNCAEIINIEVFKINKKEDIQTLFES